MGSFQLPVESGPTVVHQFEIRDGVVRASVRQYRTRLYLDLRVWYEPEPGEPPRPTKKGITVSAEAIDDLEAAVAALKAAVDGTERSSSNWGDAA